MAKDNKDIKKTVTNSIISFLYRLTTPFIFVRMLVCLNVNMLKLIYYVKD